MPGSPQTSVSRSIVKPIKSHLTGDLGSGTHAALMIVQTDDVNPLAIYLDQDGNARLPQFAAAG